MTAKRTAADFPRTDSGNAELIASMFGDRLRFDHLQKQWLICREGRWAKDCDGEVFRMAKKAARERLKVAARGDKEDSENKAAEWALQSESHHRVKAALELAKSTPPIADTGNGWNADPLLICVRNGVVNLHTGKLRPARPEDRITLQAGVAFDPAATCPRFERFLEDVFLGDKELIRYVQKTIGYSLTGDVSEQCLFLCYGEGANGKSTLLETLRHVLGSYAHNVPFSTFELKARSGISNDVAGLVSKRFVTAAETNEGAVFNEARMKSVTGGDSLSARFLYGEHFTFQPTGKVWLAFNHKPRVNDDSHGFWRRVRLIPFLAKFDGAKQDRKLPAMLRAEGSGILAWAVRGCMLWQQEGLEQPRSVSQATQAYRDESDLLADFLADCYEIDPSGLVTTAELRQDYERWCGENGQNPLDTRAMAERLRGRNVNPAKIGHARTRGWRGLRKKPDSLPDFPDHADMRTDADTKIQ